MEFVILGLAHAYWLWLADSLVQRFRFESRVATRRICFSTELCSKRLAFDIRYESTSAVGSLMVEERLTCTI